MKTFFLIIIAGGLNMSFAAPKKAPAPKATPEPVAAPAPPVAPSAPALDVYRSRSFVYGGGILKPSSVTYELQTSGLTPTAIDYNRSAIDGGVALGYLGQYNISGPVFFGLDITAEYYAILSNKTKAKTATAEADASNFTQNTSAFAVNPHIAYRLSENAAISAGFGASMNVQFGAKRDGKDLNPALSAVYYSGQASAALYLTWGRLLISPQFRYDFILGSAYTDTSGLSTRNGVQKAMVPDYIMEARLAIGYNYN